MQPLNIQTPVLRLIGVLPKESHRQIAKSQWPAFATLVNVLLASTKHTSMGLKTTASLYPLCSLLECDQNEAAYILREAYFL